MRSGMLVMLMVMVMTVMMMVMATCEEVVGKAGEGEHCTDSTLPAGKSLILFHLFPLFIGHRSNPWLSYSEHLR